MTQIRGRGPAAAQEALALLDPDIRSAPAYARGAVWERLSEPDAAGELAVNYMDDGGVVHSERARFAVPEPWEGTAVLTGAGTDLRTLCFLNRLRAALLSRPAPALFCMEPSEELSDGESMRRCRALRDGIGRIAPGAAFLRADGLPLRERGYLRASGDPAAYARAAAEGLCLCAGELLRARGGRPEGRTASVWGRGPLAEAAAACAGRRGLRVLPGEEAAELVFLCGEGAPLRAADGEALARSGAGLVLEGSLGACAPEAALRLRERGIIVAPAICAGTGGCFAPPGADAWESARVLRRGMRSLLARALSAGRGDPYRGAYVLALTLAAETLVQNGV